METGNLELLKVNPKEKVSPAKLNDVWLDLLDFFYSNTNQQSFKKFIKNLKKIISIEQEINSCRAGLELIKLGDDYGFEVLKKWKITYTDEKDINSAILRKETKLDLEKSKMSKDDKKEAVNFYRIVSNVESGLNRQLTLSEINLERWVAYLNEIKEKNEALTAEQNKKRRKWQAN